MNRPPETTIIIDNLPDKLDNWLIGIDTQFFNMSHAFKGIKSIPKGIHLVHYSIPGESENTKENTYSTLESSSRQGYWFECKEGDVLYMFWDKEHEKFKFVDQKVEEEQLNFSKALSNLGDYYNYMVSYPEDISKWQALTSNIDIGLIQEFLPQYHGFGSVNTMLSSKEERMALENALKSKDSNFQESIQNVEEMNFTIIDFKTKGPKDDTVEKVTKNYLDKSWQFQELYSDDYSIALAEIEIAFVNFIILGNFCSNVQWLNLLNLLSMSSSFMLRNRAFTLNFLNLFQCQLNIIPVDYINENAMVNMKHYVQIMENFVNDIFSPELLDGNCCGKLKLAGLITERWNNIIDINNKRFNLDIKSLESTYDDDNMEVFDINSLRNYHGDDEDLPAIV